jgi:molybdate transport system substrate-binding protein
VTKRFLVAVILALTALQTLAAQQGEPIRLIASNGVRPVLQALAPQAEKKVGHPLAAQFGTTVSLRQKIAAGEAFEVAVLTAQVIDALIKEGKIVARSRADVGSAGVGLGVRTGAKKPDIGTPDAIKQTLVNAKSITYASDGASRSAIEKMLGELGIADRVKSKIVLQQGSDAAMANVAAGKDEIVMTLVSEILQAPGIELVGPLPAKFQDYVHFAAGVSASAKNADSANALVQFLTSPAAAATYKAKGIQTAK